MFTLTHDVLLAWRGLRRTRGFTAVAVLTLAVGVAGTTVMFALIRGVLLRPLPILQQDRVIVAWKELRSSGFAHYPFGGRDVEALADASRLFETCAGVTSNGATSWVAIEKGVPQYVSGALVAGPFFDVLGVRALLGRTLTSADDVHGAENVVVISHGLWQRRYGGSRDAVGRRMTLGDRTFTVVGVLPPDFEYPRGAEVWRTVRSVPAGGTFGDAARDEIDLIARMKWGVTLEQAASELALLTARLPAGSPPDIPRDLVPVVRSFEDAVVGDTRSAMLVLLGAVCLVLLIASANAANLLLMRSEGRRRELAVHAALGAGAGRIGRQLLAESLILALAAGGAGLFVTWLGLSGLIALVPDGLPRVDSVRVDAVVVLFTVGLAFITALLAGLVPAVASMRTDVIAQLRRSGDGATSIAGAAGRRTLVAAQVALAVVVVAAAGLLTRSLVRLQSVDMGLSADQLMVADLALHPDAVADGARHARFLERLISTLEATSLIASVTPVNVPPFSGDGGWDVPRFTAEAQDAERAAANPSLNLESVHPNYFETLGVEVVRGRAFTKADREGSIPVAIVSEDVAARTWPDDDPIGKRLKMGGPASEDVWRTVVGVAARTRYRELGNTRPTLYLPAYQFLMTARMLVVRSAAPIEAVAPVMREAIGRIDDDAQLVGLTPFRAMLDRPLARPRFNTLLLTLFGAAALLLATVGVYAVIAASVRHRHREIGIRVALGATAGNVRRVVLREAITVSGIGLVAGLACAVSGTRLLRSMLFALDPLDLSTLAGAALVLIAASALAAYVPMRRATRLDPVTIFRSE